MIQQMSRRLRERDELRFFLQWLRRPAQVGAVAPSGRALAAALVAGIDIEAPGAVIELGPGTGADGPAHRLGPRQPAPRRRLVLPPRRLRPRPLPRGLRLPPAHGQARALKVPSGPDRDTKGGAWPIATIRF